MATKLRIEYKQVGRAAKNLAIQLYQALSGTVLYVYNKVLLKGLKLALKAIKKMYHSLQKVLKRVLHTLYRVLSKLFKGLIGKLLCFPLELLQKMHELGKRLQK